MSDLFTPVITVKNKFSSDFLKKDVHPSSRVQCALVKMNISIIIEQRFIGVAPLLSILAWLQVQEEELR